MLLVFLYNFFHFLFSFKWDGWALGQYGDNSNVCPSIFGQKFFIFNNKVFACKYRCSYAMEYIRYQKSQILISNYQNIELFPFPIYYDTPPGCLHLATQREGERITLFLLFFSNLFFIFFSPNILTHSQLFTLCSS